MEWRNLIKVIDEMLEVIPEDRKKLRGALEYIKTKTYYKPPELWGMFWINLQLEIEKELDFKYYDLSEKSEFEDWQKKMLNIYLGEEKFK